MAFVILKESQKISEAELDNRMKGKIASFKIPRYFLFVNSFPMTPSGKIRKVELREKALKDINSKKEVLDKLIDEEIGKAEEEIKALQNGFKGVLVAGVKAVGGVSQFFLFYCSFPEVAYIFLSSIAFPPFSVFPPPCCPFPFFSAFPPSRCSAGHVRERRCFICRLGICF